MRKNSKTLARDHAKSQNFSEIITNTGKSSCMNARGIPPAHSKYSLCCSVLVGGGWYPILSWSEDTLIQSWSGGGTPFSPEQEGVTHLVPNRGYPIQSCWGVPQLNLTGIHPVGYWMRVPPPQEGTLDQALGYHLVNRQTPVKTVPSPLLRNAGGKNIHTN